MTTNSTNDNRHTEMEAEPDIMEYKHGYRMNLKCCFGEDGSLIHQARNLGKGETVVLPLVWFADPPLNGAWVVSGLELPENPPSEDLTLLYDWIQDGEDQDTYFIVVSPDDDDIQVQITLHHGKYIDGQRFHVMLEHINDDQSPYSITKNMQLGQIWPEWDTNHPQSLIDAKTMIEGWLGSQEGQDAVLRFAEEVN